MDRRQNYMILPENGRDVYKRQAQLSSLSGVEAPRWGMATTPSMAAVSLLGKSVT